MKKESKIVRKRQTDRKKERDRESQTDRKKEKETDRQREIQIWIARQRQKKERYTR